MALELFNPPVRPSPGVDVGNKISLFEAEFGDGYTLSAPKGLNHIARTVRLKWDGLTSAQKASIEDFLRSKGGYIPFAFQPFGFSEVVKWTCKDWSSTHGVPFTLEATFVEHFTSEPISGAGAYAAATLDLNFISGIYRRNGWIRNLSDLLTISRTTPATFFDQTGALQSAVANAFRFGYDPATLQNRGLLVDSSTRTNLILNSAAPGTQTISGLAASTTYALSFWGTGSITVSGTAGLTGTLAGTGANLRSFLIFTTTAAGTAVLTITGDVRMAQFEAVGTSTPSTYIPTTSASVQRTAETVRIKNEEGWFNASEGTWVVDCLASLIDANALVQFSALDHRIDASNLMRMIVSSNNAAVATARSQMQSATISVVYASGDNNDFPLGLFTPVKFAFAWDGGSMSMCRQGGTVRTASYIGTIPNLAAVDPQLIHTGTGSMRRVTYYPEKVSDAVLQTLVA